MASVSSKCSWRPPYDWPASGLAGQGLPQVPSSPHLRPGDLCAWKWASFSKVLPSLSSVPSPQTLLSRRLPHRTAPHWEGTPFIQTGAEGLSGSTMGPAERTAPSAAGSGRLEPGLTPSDLRFTLRAQWSHLIPEILFQTPCGKLGLGVALKLAQCVARAENESPGGSGMMGIPGRRVEELARQACYTPRLQ